MLADIVNQLRGYVVSLPHEKRETGDYLDTAETMPIISDVGLDFEGVFKINKGDNGTSVSYHGNIQFIEHGKDMADYDEDVFGDRYLGAKDILPHIKQTVDGLIEGTAYQFLGMDYNSNGIWFNLKKQLLPGEVADERDRIQEVFSPTNEIYS